MQPRSSACCASCSPAPTCCSCWPRAGNETIALLPTTLDGLYGLLAASSDAPSMARALQIVEQLPDTRGNVPLPIREAQTRAWVVRLQRALQRGLETTVLDSPSYQRYAAQRQA